MPGDIGLVGGEEFRVGCEEMDREIMRASGQDPARVVVIPTAAVTGPEKAANDGVRHFSSLGGAAESLMVLDRTHAGDAGLAESLAGAGVIYFTGGSPDHLLTTLRDSLLWRAILEAADQGSVLAGSSAGAMVLGELMRRPRLGGWVDALGVTPGLAVLPHHESSDPAQTSSQLRSQTSSGLTAVITVLGIDARTGCLGRPGKLAGGGLGKGDGLPGRRLAGL